MSKLIYADTLPSGKHWSMIVRRGCALRLIDVEGGANVGMLFYNPFNLVERYNAPDTLKCQHTFKLTAGHCLYSDMGRIFCSIASDSFGWHETVCGSTTKASVAKKWGATSFQSHRNEWQQNGRDSFLVEAAKYGMQRRDLASNVNWFSKVIVDDGGVLTFDTTTEKRDAAVELLFEMDTLVLLHTCPHPLNPSSAYPRKPVRFEIRDSFSAQLANAGHIPNPENERGMENNRLFHACGCC